MRPDAERGEPATHLILPTHWLITIHDVLPELDVRRPVEGGDEAAQDRPEHVRPSGGLISEVV